MPLLPEVYSVVYTSVAMVLSLIVYAQVNLQFLLGMFYNSGKDAVLGLPPGKPVLAMVTFYIVDAVSSFFVSRLFPIQLRPAALAVFVVIIDADFSFDVIDLRVHLVIPLVRERISANPSSISINICTWFDCHRPSIFVEGDLSEKTIPSSDEFMRSVFSFLLDAERA